MEPIGFEPTPTNRQQRRAIKKSKKGGSPWLDLWAEEHLELLAQMFLLHINKIPDGIERYKAVLHEMTEGYDDSEPPVALPFSNLQEMAHWLMDRDSGVNSCDLPLAETKQSLDAHFSRLANQ